MLKFFITWNIGSFLRNNIVRRASDGRVSVTLEDRVTVRVRLVSSLYNVKMLTNSSIIFLLIFISFNVRCSTISINFLSLKQTQRVFCALIESETFKNNQNKSTLNGTVPKWTEYVHIEQNSSTFNRTVHVVGAMFASKLLLLSNFKFWFVLMFAWRTFSLANIKMILFCFIQIIKLFH